MSITDIVKAIAATADEAAQRLANAIDQDTSGPEPTPDVHDIIPPPHPRWVDGWWVDAVKRPAHPHRIGGPISAFTTIVHATAMLPDDFDALVKATTEREGKRNAYHFLVGRDQSQGVVQVCPIDRNGNHAGGPTHGVFVTPKGKTYHPNLVAIGIEMHCALGVQRIEGRWRLVEAGKVHGPALPDEDVTQDPHRPNRGWHKLTDYQFQQLDRLLTDIDAVQAPMPPGTVARSTFQTPEEWALAKTGRIVGHCSLDFAARRDPGPQGMEWIRNR